jgi:hypothetical protein
MRTGVHVDERPDEDRRSVDGEPGVLDGRTGRGRGSL